MSKLQDKLAELVATTVGAEGAALIDIETGMTLAHAGVPEFDLDVAASGFATAVRYQLRTIVDLGLEEPADGVLIAGSHHHVFAVRTNDNKRACCSALRRDGAPVDGPPPGRDDGRPAQGLTYAEPTGRGQAASSRLQRHHQVRSMPTRMAMVTYQAKSA